MEFVSSALMRRGLIATALIGLALVIGGCGGDD
jgi:hypothetical protein